ncbi:RluA family pseudouridine synthase [Shewanella sp. 202IG2-18]|uniref:pseudouridine synthase family protein n=1 Tax=Parashewanella hymeniacidonis TaxID=2807618 RepID=UPI00195F51A7|nr:RluA family pseudouridine synthase [Parashewanella hymeniacidonis]MBM7074110.1 RluA family pseudouridine synthase [Parashewanella hymeniacidonis]
MDTLELPITVNEAAAKLKITQLLANESKLSQSQIKDAMQKGAVWLQRGKNKQRVRRASKPLQVGDKVEFNYNSQLLATSAKEPELISDAGDYSIWFKPYGLNCQGSRWCDHLSINRWVEMNFHKLTDTQERPVFLVHRLDRATSGLILLCHSKKAARIFSDMFGCRQMDKRYQAIVHGDLSDLPTEFRVDQEIDGKPSSSIFSFVDKLNDYSLLDVKLLTGRKHQIRKHLSHLGHPIVGDRLYSEVVDESRDLQLQAVSLSFICPFTNKNQKFCVDKSKRLTL